MKILKWGFIGCGDVAEKKSGPAFKMVEGSTVVAVMSRSEQKARSYAERHGIERWYADAQELIDDPEVNAVYVATPPSSHAAYAMMALRAGKPVYVEKPLAVSYDDCARINHVSQQTGVPCFVAYYRRYLPYFQRVGQLLENGAVGRVLSVSVRLSLPPRDADHSAPSDLPWRLRPEIAGAGYFYDLAPHQLDLLQQYFGVIIEARGICTNRSHLYKAEDTVTACFQFENGIPGIGQWCFTAHESAQEDRIEVIGSEGKLSFSVFSYKPILLVNRDGTQTLDVPTPEIVQLPIVKSVVEHLQGKGVCECTSVSATPVNWVLDRILKKL